MKIALTLFASLFCYFSLALAHADPVQALAIHVDYYPNTKYAILIDLDSNNAITKVYYQTNDNKDAYTLDDLQKPVTLFEKAGFNLVQMKIASHSGTTAATIELIYTQNYLSHRTASLFFDVSYNLDSAKWEVKDNRTHQVITQANVATRYNLVHFPIGILSITTQ